MNQEPTAIENQIEKNVEEISNELDLNECIMNDRQEDIIKKVYRKIESAIEIWNRKELVAVFLNESLKEIEQYSGKISNEEILDNIFNKFCIGK